MQSDHKTNYLRHKIMTLILQHFNPESATYNLQQTAIAKFAVFLKTKTNKACYFMRIICWQTILMQYHTLFFVENLEWCRKICRLLQKQFGALTVNNISLLWRWHRKIRREDHRLAPQGLLRNPIHLWLFREGGPDPCPPLWFRVW